MRDKDLIALSKEVWDQTAAVEDAKKDTEPAEDEGADARSAAGSSRST